MENGLRHEPPQEDGPANREEGDVHPARILISSTRKPVSYINLAKRFLQEYGEVQLSALGIAVSPMVTVAEILKGRRLAVEKRLTTSLESLSGEYRTRQKPKMEVLLVKSDVFEEVMADEAQCYGTYGSGVPYDSVDGGGSGEAREDEGEVVAEGNIADGPEGSAALAVGCESDSTSEPEDEGRGGRAPRQWQPASK